MPMQGPPSVPGGDSAHAGLLYSNEEKPLTSEKPAQRGQAP